MQNLLNKSKKPEKTLNLISFQIDLNLSFTQNKFPMTKDCISYQNSGYFTPMMNDYLNQESGLQSFYNRFPTIENFENQIKEKQQNFNTINKNAGNCSVIKASQVAFFAPIFLGIVLALSNSSPGMSCTSFKISLHSVTRNAQTPRNWM